MVKRRVLTAIIALVITGAAVGLAYATLETGAKAPDFTAPTIDGKKFTLSDLFKKPSKVVVLDLWATWCPPCRAEIPYLVKLHNTYSKKGLAVVGVSLDTDKEKVKSFVKDNKITYTVPLDPKGDKVARAYKIRGIPTTYVIDRKGVIRFVHTGFSGKTEADKIENEVKQLLDEK